MGDWERGALAIWVSRRSQIGQNPTLVRVCGSAREERNMLKSCFLSCKDGRGAGELAQWLTALAAFAEYSDQVPGMHMVAHNSITPVPMNLMPSLF